MSPEDVMARYTAAWESGEPEAAFEFFADDIVMRMPGRGFTAGVHKGREAVIAVIQQMLERTSGLPAEMEVVEMFFSADRVALVSRAVVTRGDEVLEQRRVNVYRIEGEKIAEADIYEGTQYEVDEFFG